MTTNYERIKELEQQLQQKEAEIEELKKQLQTTRNIKDFLEKQVFYKDDKIDKLESHKQVLIEALQKIKRLDDEIVRGDAEYCVNTAKTALKKVGE